LSQEIPIYKGASKLSFKEKLCYGLGDISNGLAVSSISVWFLYYLTDIAGLGAFLAGVAVTIGRLWDAVTDPIMGWITDHTKSRWGKRLPYLLFGSVPYALAYFCLWTIPSFETEREIFIYVTVVLLFFNTCLTVVFVPYTSLTASITDDYDERTSLTGYRMFCSQIAFLIGASAPPIIAAWAVESQYLQGFSHIFGSWSGTARKGYFITASIFAFIIIASILTTFFGIKHRAAEETPTQNDSGATPLSYASGIVEQLFGNRPFLISALILLFANCAATMAASGLPYYLEYVVELENQRGSILFTLFATAIISVPMWVSIAKRFGKAESFRVAMVLYIAVLLTMPFLGPDSGNVIYPISVLIGFFHAAALVLPWAIVPDVVEYDELKSGKRREGLFYGGTTFTYKAATGIAFLLSSALLEFSGYSAGTQQSEITLRTMRFLSGPAPAFFLLAAAILALRYPLTGEKHRLIVAELSARKTAS